MAGTLVVPYTGNGAMSIKLAGALLFAGGEIGAVLNPEGHTLIITGAYVYVTTVSAGACNLVVGTTATSISTSSNNMLTATSIAAGAAGHAYYCGPVKTMALDSLVWNAGEWITCTGSASSVGLVGTLHVQYIHADVNVAH